MLLLINRNYPVAKVEELCLGISPSCVLHLVARKHSFPLSLLPNLESGKKNKKTDTV